MKDDLETNCMNEIFGKYNQMIAQVYVKSDKKYTSILVCRGNNVYYNNVIDTPELTGIQRGVSFVKHQLDADTTEIYPDKLDIQDILKDEFISHCGKNTKKGENPNDKMIEMCESSLQSKNRWDITQYMEKQNGKSF